MEKLNSKAMHKFSFWYYGKSMFSTFFTNFQARSRVLFNPPARFPLAGWSQSLCTQSTSVRWRPGRILKPSGPLVKLLALGQESWEVHCASWRLIQGLLAWRLGFSERSLKIRLSQGPSSQEGSRFLQTGPFHPRKWVNSFDKPRCHRSSGKVSCGTSLCCGCVCWGMGLGMRSLGTLKWQGGSEKPGHSCQMNLLFSYQPRIWQVI